MTPENRDCNRMIQAHPIYRRVVDFIHAGNLFSGIRHVDVALSGGADSVCLLALLSAMPRDFSLRAHHIRHHLRQDDQLDAELARKTADILGIEYVQTDLSWPGDIPQSNVEENARNARYHALFEAIREPETSALALAHHGDENLETALWRLGRGCGLEGLCLAARRIVEGITLVRPLLMVSKDEIYQFLRDNHLKWAEDPSNQSHDYRRNRIRSEILPLIKSEAMSGACLYRSLIGIRNDAEALASFAEEFVSRFPVRAGCWFCPWDVWNSLELPALLQVLRHAARAVLPGHCPDAQFVSDALQMIQARAQTCRQIENGHIHIGWFHGGIMIWSENDDEKLPDIAFEIPCQDLQIRHIGKLTCWYSVPESPLKNTTSILHLDAECLDGPLSIRAASNYPMLRSSTGNLRKTTEALRSQGVPDKWISQWPVLCVSNRPIWILGGMRTLEARPAIPGQKAASFMMHWQSP